MKIRNTIMIISGICVCHLLIWLTVLRKNPERPFYTESEAATRCVQMHLLGTRDHFIKQLAGRKPSRADWPEGVGGPRPFEITNVYIRINATEMQNNTTLIEIHEPDILGTRFLGPSGELTAEPPPDFDTFEKLK